MAKRLALIVAMLFIPALARADNIVTVAMNPVEFWSSNGSRSTRQILGPEIVAVTFTWNNTTGVLSNIIVAATGPFQNSPNNPTTLTGFQGPTISFLQFALTSPSFGGASYQLNYGDHGNLIPPIGITPGTYRTDLNVFCGDCLGGFNFAIGTATVTAVSTPEPNTLILLAAGLAALALAIYARGNRWTVESLVARFD
jgi:hypothetical protein